MRLIYIDLRNEYKTTVDHASQSQYEEILVHLSFNMWFLVIIVYFSSVIWPAELLQGYVFLSKIIDIQGNLNYPSESLWANLNRVNKSMIAASLHAYAKIKLANQKGTNSNHLLPEQISPKIILKLEDSIKRRTVQNSHKRVITRKLTLLLRKICRRKNLITWQKRRRKL